MSISIYDIKRGPAMSDLLACFEDADKEIHFSIAERYVENGYEAMKVKNFHIGGLKRDIKEPGMECMVSIDGDCDIFEKGSYHHTGFTACYNTDARYGTIVFGN